jgi:hypothetical protein
MNDTALTIGILVVAIGGLAAIAYLIDRRRKSGQENLLGLPDLGRPLGPVGRGLLWAIRGLVVAMVLSFTGFFVFSSLTYLYVAAACLVLYLVLGRILQIVRLSGK